MTFPSYQYLLLVITIEYKYHSGYTNVREKRKEIQIWTIQKHRHHWSQDTGRRETNKTKNKNKPTKDETNKQKTSTTKEISDTDCVIKTPGYPGAGEEEGSTHHIWDT